MSEERWIVIPNWEKFQHYKTRSGERVSRPDWIKNYTRLLHDDAYLHLTFPQRGVLHGLWIAYASGGTCIRLDLKMINRTLGASAKMATLDALNHAGFIEYSSRPTLEQVYTSSSLEEKRIEKALIDKRKEATKGEPELVATGARAILEHLRRKAT